MVLLIIFNLGALICSSKMMTCLETADDCNLGSLNCSTVSPEKSFKSKHLWRINSSDDDMCQIDDSNDITMGEGRLNSSLMPDNFKVTSLCQMSSWIFLKLR